MNGRTSSRKSDELSSEGLVEVWLNIFEFNYEFLVRKVLELIL